MYDGPTAIKPLTVTPQPQHSAPPNSLCDFEHQCYPEKGGPTAPAPVAPPAIVVKPITPRHQAPDEPIVATWRGCMGRALQAYEQSHNLHALQVATGSCQVRLEEQGGEDYAGAEPPVLRRCLRGWVIDATSVAAGGPSAATPTATVRRGSSPLLTTASAGCRPTTSNTFSLRRSAGGFGTVKLAGVAGASC